jgi:O-antigen/teichoic acid export membrane protein
VHLPRIKGQLGGIASIVSGSVAGQGLTILAYPLLTRLYSPSEFGLLAVFSAVVGMIAVVSTATLDAAVPIPGEDRDAATVAWASLGCVALTSVLTALTGIVAAVPLAKLLGVPPLADFWWLVAATVAAFGAYAVLSKWMIRDRSYGALGRRNLLQGVGQVGTQLGLGLAGAGAAGLMLGMGVGRLFGLGGLLSRGGLLRQPLPRLHAIRAMLGRFRRFPQLAMPSAFLNSAGLELPVLLIAALYGDAKAGFLGLALRAVGGPAAIIGQAANQVFTGESSAAIRDPQGMLGSAVRRSVLRLLAVGAGPTAVLVAAGPLVFAFVFGAEWSEAGEYARYLAAYFLAAFAVTPVSTTLWLLERQGRELGWVTFRLLMTVGLPALCGALGASITTAIIALGIGHVVSYALLYLLSVHAADAADRRVQSGKPDDGHSP